MIRDRQVCSVAPTKLYSSTDTTAGSCTANSISACYAFEINRLSRRDTPLFYPSRSFIYYNARTKGHKIPDPGTLLPDKGSAIRTAMQGLQYFGVCLDVSWPLREVTIG
jgi:hypothetical protein